MAKRWRLRYVPTSIEEGQSSKLAAYRTVQHFRELREQRMTRFERIAVLVSEDRGPWQLYETVDL